MNPDQRACLTLQQQVESLWAARRFAEALQSAEAELAAAQKGFGPKHPMTARALWDLSLAKRGAGQASEAEALERQAQGLLEELQAEAERRPNAPETAELLLFLADREWNLVGDSPRVRERLARAWRICEEQAGGRTALGAQVLADRAALEYLGAQWAAAVPLFEQSIQTYENLRETDHLHYVKAVEGLANSLAALGRPAEALPWFRKALDWADRYGREPQAFYYVLLGTAGALKAGGDAAAAEPFEQRAAALLPKTTPGEAGFHV